MATTSTDKYILVSYCLRDNSAQARGHLETIVLGSEQFELIGTLNMLLDHIVLHKRPNAPRHEVIAMLSSGSRSYADPYDLWGIYLIPWRAGDSEQLTHGRMRSSSIAQTGLRGHYIIMHTIDQDNDAFYYEFDDEGRAQDCYNRIYNSFPEEYCDEAVRMYHISEDNVIRLLVFDCPGDQQTE